MNSRLTSLLCLVIAFSGISACSGRQDPTEMGIARLSTPSIPADVQCLSLTATGSTTVVRNFDVVQNQIDPLTATGLPTGTVTLTEAAYNVHCSEVTANTAPTWISDPVVAQLVPGQPASVTIVLRRAGQVVVTSLFDDGVDGGVAVDGGKTDVPGAQDVVKYDVPGAQDVVKYDVPGAQDIVNRD